MGIDVRLPIGLMFTVFGAMMTVYGAFGSQAIYFRSLGVNINMTWGIVMLAFGAVMLLLGWRGHRRADSVAARITTDRHNRSSRSH